MIRGYEHILHRQLLHDLWGDGFTLVPRSRHPDPFHVEEHLKPKDRFYQWFSLKEDKVLYTGTGWSPVPHARHPGIFAPYGTGGDIEVQGLGLFDKSAVEVERDRAQQAEAANKPLKEWMDKFSEFTGGARVVRFDEADKAVVTEIVPGNKTLETRVETVERPKEKTIELVSKVPFDMLEHMSAIFTERDRLKDDIVLPDRSLKPGEIADKFYAAVEADKTLPWWPTLHAILLPIAVENVRAKLKESQETTS